jgi:hypothetical protein
MSVDPRGQIQTQIFAPQMPSQVSEQPKKQSLGLQVNLPALRMFETYIIYIKPHFLHCFNIINTIAMNKFRC